MIHAYAVDNDGPKRLEIQELPEKSTTQETLWLHLTAPSDNECKQVAERFSLPIEHIKAVLDFNERPRQEYDQGIFLLISRTPISDDTVRRVPFSTCPVGIVLAPKLIVTVCLHEGVVEALLSRKLLGKGEQLELRLALTLLLRISTAFLDSLQQMDALLVDMEKRLKESLRNEELMRMLHLEKSLIYFLTALKGNQSVLDKLRACPGIDNAQAHALLDDVAIENKQATDMADIYSRILESVSDSFGAVISNNLNKVMKVLTSLTVVLMIPSIIGALYGMNVALPAQDHPHAFAVLTLLCVVFSVALFLLLRKKDWM